MEDDENSSNLMLNQQNTQLQYGINNFSALEVYEEEEDEGMIMDEDEENNNMLLMQDN